ncbi:MAG TPA: tRNA pseudouridine(55) synthase TruB, partial [Actinobacteria bacterium]|nr:tRNA pseudouridine(55) synthase TruB [Actinomycetota bacterium]
MPAGLLLVDKPAGITSHDVVARVRRIFNTRKVGHAGTLDPMATGVLVLGINSGTRLLGHLTTSHKTYLGTIRLGAASSTDDREGELGPLTRTSDLQADEIEAALEELRGEILQRPSSVSAIKIDGRRAYARVRDGQVVDIPERSVTVFNLEVVHMDSHGDFLDIEVNVMVSSGTYIRAIARDLGVALGVGGHLTALRRTSVGAFGQEVANDLGLLESAADPWVHTLSLAQVATLTWPIFDMGVDQSAAVRMGQRISWPDECAQPVIALIDHQGILAAIAQRVDES